ncbi:MAG TPA: PSD1 and planctomycete cytochrome C domain-containing protein [Candidatus Limnocylindria bacterium]|nr:PSD1 and planctomycete cytochrome C domain-containing protein [Candidatus Limnocylindria bacterium]
MDQAYQPSKWAEMRIALIAGMAALAGTTAWAETPKVDFTRDIQPLLAQRCYDCHDGRKVKGGLRLDMKYDFLRGGDSGKPPLVAGKSAESVLFQRVTTSKDDEVMPPKGDKLTPAQIALLRDWIDQGADWPESAAKPKPHWSYVPPTRPAQPSVKDAGWPRSALDAFVLARLEKEGLKPSPEADRAALIRRVSLDLTGLPPSPEQVNAFIADRAPDAYEKVVDRLLKSRHYGERWARPWLDMARYADTQGFEKDDRRSIWPYRDWVIESLNDNMPFDEFTVEQIAGDLLPNATRNQVIATGFHRNTMTNTEGGTDNEEFRHEAIVDRINTTFGVWMGTTINCAQCHNHKYDPITMRDFYSVYAILNQTADADRDDDAPFIEVPTASQEKEKSRLESLVAQSEASYQASPPEFTRARKSWEASQRDYLAAWHVLTPDTAASGNGAVLKLRDDARLVVEGTNAIHDSYVLTLATPFSRVTGVRIEALPWDSLPEKSAGRGPEGAFALSQVNVQASSRDNPGAYETLKIARVSADQTRKNFDAQSLVTGSTGPGWSAPNNRDAHAVHLFFEAPVDFPAGTLLQVTLRHDSALTNANLGSFRIAATGLRNPPVETPLPTGLVGNIQSFAAQRSEEQTKTLDEYFRKTWPGLSAVREDLARNKADLDKVKNGIPTTLVMRTVEKPRETHILIRGSFLTRGDKIGPAVPGVFPPANTNAPLDRLAFAKWLVSTNNPLTARVQVNRHWEQFFGRGIVETTEEFGKQGEPPTNPELLDWLATEFMDSGWDLKALHKTIVMSATYRQSSRVTPELAEKDPNNRYLGRGPRVRLEAEMLRDVALTASGLLSEKEGGRSVMPKQPDGIWQVVYSGDRWETSAGEDRYRRGIYTFWRRSSPHPMMVNFDAPSREFCVLKRGRSNTPLQALNLLNDPAFIEFAQALGRRAIRDGGSTLESQMTFAFQACVARQPKSAELARLTALFHEEAERFRKDPVAAEKMATSQLGALPKDQNVAEAAAWTVVANVLLNLDEAITKG